MPIQNSYFSGGVSLPLRSAAKYGEPAHGYFVRHIAENRVHSARVCATNYNFNGRDFQPMELLAYLEGLQMGGKDRLIAATPIFEGNDVTLMGETVRRKHWSIGRRRFCPACLAEEPYHRTWWDLVPYRRCPFHDLELVSTDVAGNPVGWWVPSFQYSAELKSLRRFGVARIDNPPPTLESYILMRLGALPRDRAFPLLDGFGRLGDVFTLVDRLGYALGSGDGVEPSSEAVFAMLVEGDRAVHAAFDRLACSMIPEVPGRRGVEVLFGDRFRNLSFFAARGAPIDYILDVMREVARDHGYGSRSRRHARTVKGRIGLNTIADSVGVQPETVRKLLVRMGIRDPSSAATDRYFGGVSPKEADRFHAAFAQLKTSDEAAALLGIDRRLFDGLVRIGALSVATKRKNVPLFLTGEVEAIARKIDRAPRVLRIPDDLVRLGDLGLVKHGPLDFWLRLALDAGRPTYLRCGSGIEDLLVDRRPEGRQRAAKIRR